MNDLALLLVIAMTGCHPADLASPPRHQGLVTVRRPGRVVRVEVHAPAPPAPASPDSAWGQTLESCAANPTPTEFQAMTCCLLLESEHWDESTRKCR